MAPGIDDLAPCFRFGPAMLGGPPGLAPCGGLALGEGATMAGNSFLDMLRAVFPLTSRPSLLDLPACRHKFIFSATCLSTGCCDAVLVLW